MAIVRLAMLIVGILAFLVGLLWIGQGTGLIRWPAESFMIDMSDWALRGAVLALGGAIMVWCSRSGRPS